MNLMVKIRRYVQELEQTVWIPSECRSEERFPYGERLFQKRSSVWEQRTWISIDLHDIFLDLGLDRHSLSLISPDPTRAGIRGLSGNLHFLHFSPHIFFSPSFINHQSMFKQPSAHQTYEISF